jgi:ribonuclease H2 subunit A
MKEKQFEQLGFFSAILSAQMLSTTMMAQRDKGGSNLNDISHNTAIGLIKKVQGLGFRVKKVILDTVGQPQKYKGIIERALGDNSIQVVVESKADDKFPVVSAASICAKVTRDYELNNYVYPEQHKEFSKNLGCGYPGDKDTRAWLREHMDPVFGFPSLVRFSWKTS